MRSRSDRRHNKPVAISLFSGAGGFCEGVRLAGYEVICAVENDRDASRTHSANFPEVPLFSSDIRKFLRDEKPGVPGKNDLAAQEIDLVYGGPPCQGFSQIGPRDPRDPRNLLYKEFVRVIAEISPKIFVMENVPNILAMRNGHYSDQIAKAFRNAGYRRTAIFTLLASHFGVPQNRKRVFFIGLRNGLQLNVAFEDLCTQLFGKQKCKRTVTVRQALSDLPASVSEDDDPLPYPKLRPGRCPDYQRLMRLDCDTSLLTAVFKRRQLNGNVSLFNHHTKSIGSRRQRIIEAIQPGMRGDSLPEQLWNGTRAHKWRRLDPQLPSYTILAQMHRDLSEWIHPEYNRWITVREAARLQSFHDGFIFHGSEVQQLKQVGNAVPPLMALAIARAAAQLLEALQGAQ
jgi:DNA (cytosine-5)-methyltransferase 1